MELYPLVTDVKPPAEIVTPEDKEELIRIAMERAAMIPRR